MNPLSPTAERGVLSQNMTCSSEISNLLFISHSTGYIGPVSIYLCFILGTVINTFFMAPVVERTYKREMLEGSYRWVHRFWVREGPKTPTPCWKPSHGRGWQRKSRYINLISNLITLQKPQIQEMSRFIWKSNLARAIATWVQVTPLEWTTLKMLCDMLTVYALYSVHHQEALEFIIIFLFDPHPFDLLLELDSSMCRSAPMPRQWPSTWPVRQRERRPTRGSNVSSMCRPTSSTLTSGSKVRFAHFSTPVSV